MNERLVVKPTTDVSGVEVTRVPASTRGRGRPSFKAMGPIPREIKTAAFQAYRKERAEARARKKKSA